jgi:hypothetical protein
VRGKGGDKNCCCLDAKNGTEISSLFSMEAFRGGIPKAAAVVLTEYEVGSW